MSNTRNHILKFRVDDTEYEILKQKNQLSKCKNMSDFLRRISLGGQILNVDMSELEQMKKLIKNIADNINQISHLANMQKSIYKDDLDEIKEKISQIWQQQAYIRSLLHKLERSHI